MELNQYDKDMISTINHYYEKDGMNIFEESDFNIPSEQIIESVRHLAKAGIPITISNHRPRRRIISIDKEYLRLVKQKRGEQ